MSLTTKRCPKCREYKMHAAFDAVPERADGLAVRCRECVAEQEQRAKK